MKKQITIKSALTLSVILIASVFMQSCVFSTRLLTRIYEEEDLAYSTKRITMEYMLQDISRSPLVYMEQSLVKEINANGEVNYRAYDILTLEDDSFNLKDEVYIIIDGEAYRMNIDNTERNTTTSISENHSDVMTADSNNVSVVTGYTQHNRKITRFSYEISNDIVSKLLHAESVRLQYYAGPSMISLPLSNQNLKKLDEFIEME